MKLLMKMFCYFSITILLSACSAPLTASWHEKRCTKGSQCWKNLSAKQRRQLAYQKQGQQQKIELEKQKLKTYQSSTN